MKHITEDYVSIETAKLLKEKGFDEHCGTAYTTTEGYPIRIMGSTYSLEKNSDYDEFHYSMPSQSLALKWLREVHHYYIQIMLDSWACGGHSGYYVVIQKTDSDFEMMLQDVVDEVFYQTYEEAVEAALKYTLENLI